MSSPPLRTGPPVTLIPAHRGQKEDDHFGNAPATGLHNDVERQASPAAGSVRAAHAEGSLVQAFVGRHSWCRTLPTIVRRRNLPQNSVGIAKVEFLAPVDDWFGFREIALQFLESRVDGEALNPDAKVMNLRLPELEECYEAVRKGKSCTFDFRPLVRFNRSTRHRSTEQPGIKLLGSFNVGNAQRHVIQRATAKGGHG